jgi:hypothetical protein
MGFEKSTRNALAKMVLECRRLLTADVRDQLQRVYGLQPDGTHLPIDRLRHLDERGKQTALELSEWHEHLTSTEMGTDTQRRAAALDRLVHETAFTALNRLAALRLCEERKHVIECVRRGMESDGFKLFERLSGGALGSRATTYRAFLERIFDELAVDLGVLFDLRDPQSLVFPSETCLERVIDILNEANLAHLWKDDETIGWVYQYFNPREERDAMRKASAAPRNSRELAVRNQFFTPRYVIEFLTDNTLGRIWYEMRRGETRLIESCRYLFRKPTEIFLELDQEPPEEQNAAEQFSQQELLRSTVYVPFRAKKDPRDLRILDPACGSGHFLLYAFDLFEIIYEEAWKDKDSPPSIISGKTLREEYQTLDSLQRAIPSLILRHNLHGIDIDARCCQIAALALWLRAQRCYQQLGLKNGERPQITRSNIVCAEPIPGDSALMAEFLAQLRLPFLRQLLTAVFDKMNLAGEAGSLLLIDQDIRGAIEEAKRQWIAAPVPEQLLLLPGLQHQNRPSEQLRLFDTSGITDATFWEEAEAGVMHALREYAATARNVERYRRQLFADDAARGFAFIDACRERYDIVVMNPPFGEAPLTCRRHLYTSIQSSTQDLFAAFVDRACQLISPRGHIGVISSRLAFYKDTLASWRQRLLLGIPHRLKLVADLGYGVLDGAVVEAAAYVVTTEPRQLGECAFFSLLDRREKELALRKLLSAQSGSGVFFHQLESFLSVPSFIIAYWCARGWLARFQSMSSLGSIGVVANKGLETGTDFRSLRLLWEIPIGSLQPFRAWTPYSKGGSYQPFHADIHLLFNWADRDTARRQSHSDLYGCAGLTYIERTTSNFTARVLPAGTIFSQTGPGIIDTKDAAPWGLLGLLTSSVAIFYFELLTGGGDSSESGTAARHFAPGFVTTLPCPKDCRRLLADISARAERIYHTLAPFRIDEHSTIFESIPAGLGSLREQIKGRFHKYEESVLDAIRVAAEIDTLVEEAYGLTDVEKGDLKRYLGRPLPTRSILTDAEAQIVGDVFRSRKTAVEEDTKDMDTRGRALTKLGYVADQRYESTSAALGISPDAVAIARRAKDVVPLNELQNDARCLISYAVGCAFGRWDIRLATGERASSLVLDPFEQVPTCTGILLEAHQGSEFSRPAAYPSAVNGIGILTDGEGGRNDLLTAIHIVFQTLFGDRAQSIEYEAAELLEFRSIGDYIRNNSGFFADHLKDYSRSRRQAPIYWPLSTSSKSFTLWLYYHKLDDQLLYRAVNDYVNPKIVDTERLIKSTAETLRAASGQEATRLRAVFESYRPLLEELNELKLELLRVASLPFKPNLNDGVLITAAPLWKLFRLPKWRTDLEDCWRKLEVGEYDWAHLAYAIWSGRVQEKCRTDRSLAIAHGIEHLCAAANPTSASKPRKRRAGKSSRLEQANIELVRGSSEK